MIDPGCVPDKSGDRRSRTRRRVLLVFGCLLALLMALLARPVLHIVSTTWKESGELEPLPPGVVDDASRMNRTEVAEVWPIPNKQAAAEEQLAALLQRARREDLRVSIAGARHSMGGHTIYPDGIVINMLPFKSMELDEDENILHVQAGALWEDVIAYLDPRGRDAGKQLIRRRRIDQRQLPRLALRPAPDRLDG